MAAASRGLSCPSASFPPSPFPETPRSRLYLHNAADDHGEDIQGEAENVEQSQGHEGLLGIQDVVLVEIAQLIPDETYGTLIPAGDPDLLAETLRKTLADPAGSASKGKAAAVRIREAFSLDASCRQYWETFRF